MEHRHTEFSPVSPNQREFAGWVDRLPGRVFVLTQWPPDPRVWMAVTLEDQ